MSLDRQNVARKDEMESAAKSSLQPLPQLPSTTVMVSLKSRLCEVVINHEPTN